MSATLTGIHIQGNLITSDLTNELQTGDIKGQLAQDFGIDKVGDLEDEIALF